MPREHFHKVDVGHYDGAHTVFCHARYYVVCEPDYDAECRGRAVEVYERTKEDRKAMMKRFANDREFFRGY